MLLQAVGCVLRVVAEQFHVVGAHRQIGEVIDNARCHHTYVVAPEGVNENADCIWVTSRQNQSTFCAATNPMVSFSMRSTGQYTSGRSLIFFQNSRIPNAGILFEKLDQQGQQRLPRYMVKRLAINPESKILRLELRTPFGYLHELSANNVPVPQSRLDGSCEEKNQTSRVAAGSILLWLAGLEPLVMLVGIVSVWIISSAKRSSIRTPTKVFLEEDVKRDTKQVIFGNNARSSHQYRFTDRFLVLDPFGSGRKGPSHEQVLV